MPSKYLKDILSIHQSEVYDTLLYFRVQTHDPLDKHHWPHRDSLDPCFRPYLEVLNQELGSMFQVAWSSQVEYMLGVRNSGYLDWSIRKVGETLQDMIDVSLGAIFENSWAGHLPITRYLDGSFLAVSASGSNEGEVVLLIPAEPPDCVVKTNYDLVAFLENMAVKFFPSNDILLVDFSSKKGVRSDTAD